MNVNVVYMDCAHFPDSKLVANMGPESKKIIQMFSRVNVFRIGRGGRGGWGGLKRAQGLHGMGTHSKNVFEEFVSKIKSKCSLLGA